VNLFILFFNFFQKQLFNLHFLMCLDQTEASRREFLKMVGAFSLIDEGSFDTTQLSDKEKDKQEKMPKIYDLIIVGAGTAGMPCAIEAAARGRQVLVIEKADRVGGTLPLTGGHMSAGGTQHQHREGIQDSIEAHFAEVMQISNQTAPPELVRLAVTEAPRTIDWLDSLGFEFAPESPRIVYGHVPYHVARTQYGKDAGKSILKVILPLWDKYIANGHITIKLEHRLEKILLDQGEVKGVTVSFRDNIEKYFGKKTVLTTGGYAANSALFSQFHPQHPRLISTAAPTSTGEAIQIAQEIGAQFWNADKHISSLGGIEEMPQTGKADFWSAWAMVFTTSYRPAREVYVNALGQQFMDETNPDPDYRERKLAQQLDKKMWCIFDEKSLMQKDAMNIVPKWSVDQLKMKALEGKCCWQADTLAELAQKSGLPVAAFEETIRYHNQKVATNETTLPAINEGPFYALLTYATSLISFGGLAVNAQLEVLDTQHNRIKNLYAAGEILGAGATTGNAFCGGMLVTPALSFGRWLGQHL
jgi:succinate dehydrogenase/fumarate reductase flavoprotein subunit